jgi:SAM-dependent methyltransferase
LSDSEYGPPSGSAFPPVLDACCGPRSFWYDRKDARAVFVDKRKERFEYTHKDRAGVYSLEIAPDMQTDFTSLPFPDNTFAHVVFDPPHILNLGANSYTARWYGKLPGDWRDMLREGFAECFRVLRPEGTLIFKWCEYEIPLRDVLALTPHRPLYGHMRGRQSKTHWIAFLKPNGGLDRHPGGGG